MKYVNAYPNTMQVISKEYTDFATRMDTVPGRSIAIEDAAEKFATQKAIVYGALCAVPVDAMIVFNDGTVVFHRDDGDWHLRIDNKWVAAKWCSCNIYTKHADSEMLVVSEPVVFDGISAKDTVATAMAKELVKYNAEHEDNVIVRYIAIHPSNSDMLSGGVVYLQ